MENLLSTPDCENILELRDKAVMELMYSSALRISEVCGLLINDVDTQNRTVWIRQGKAGSNRLVPMGKRAAFWLEKYRTESRPVLEKGLYTKPSNHQPRDNHRFFLSIFGCPLSGDSFSLRLKTYLKKAGIPRGNGQTHLFRRTCATHLHEAGMDIRLIQVLLGHKNLQMTVRYTQVNLKKLREVHELFHPQSVKEVNREK
jgi:integrase/recombinase XerD